MIASYTWFGRENKIRIPKDDKLIVVENAVTEDIYSYKDNQLIYYEKAWHLFIEQNIKSLCKAFDETQEDQQWSHDQRCFSTKISVVKRLSLAVDFDDTLFKADTYPVPTNPIQENIDLCKKWKELDLILILYTAREGQKLDLAVQACKDIGLTFDYVNENLPWGIAQWGDSRKIVADYYLDDRNISSLDLDKVLGGQKCL